jgi:hypothetical protein
MVFASKPETVDLPPKLVAMRATSVAATSTVAAGATNLMMKRATLPSAFSCFLAFISDLRSRVLVFFTSKDDGHHGFLTRNPISSTGRSTW